MDRVRFFAPSTPRVALAAGLWLLAETAAVLSVPVADCVASMPPGSCGPRGPFGGAVPWALYHPLAALGSYAAACLAHRPRPGRSRDAAT